MFGFGSLVFDSTIPEPRSAVPFACTLTLLYLFLLNNTLNYDFWICVFVHYLILYVRGQRDQRTRHGHHIPLT